MKDSVMDEKLAKHITDIKLSSLLEVTKAINSNYSTEKLLDIFKSVLETKLRIVRLSIFINGTDGWNCVLQYGLTDAPLNLDMERDLLHIKEIRSVYLSEHALNEQFDIIIPVFHKSHPIAYALIGDDEERIESSPSYQHLDFVQTLTSIIIVAIENKRLVKENIIQAALNKELELAKEMQTMLFPAKLPSNERIDVAAFYLPHQKVGGDYYDFSWLNDNECAFCVADVSGKGVAAALLMSNFQATLRVLFKHTTSLTKLVRVLNTIVMATAKGEKFITFFIAKYNFATRTLTYINAAHNPPVLTNGNTTTLLTKGCTGLGMFNKIEHVEEGIVQLKPGSTLFCYTDGLVELENLMKDDYGVERLQKVVEINSEKTMDQLNKTVMDAVIDYKHSNPFVDDIAILSLKIP